MDQMFTIGKMASLTGISVQALRYYDKLGLLRPTYVNPTTGYRYYSYNHLQIINRIPIPAKSGVIPFRYQRGLRGRGTSVLRSKLSAIQNSLYDELEQLWEKCRNIEWYISYFDEADPTLPLCIPYFRHFDERYILACDVKDGNEADAYLRFNKIKNHPSFQKLDCYLWHVYRMKFSAVSDKQFYPQQLGFFICKKPEFFSPHVLVIPEGNYICFKCHMRNPGWNPELFLRLFSPHNTPGYVLACEYEKDLFEFSNSIFEVQALYLP